MTEHNDVLQRHTVMRAYVAHEGVGIADQSSEVGGVTTRSWRTAVTAGVPGEKRESRQIDAVDQPLPATGVLMTAVE